MCLKALNNHASTVSGLFGIHPKPAEELQEERRRETRVEIDSAGLYGFWKQGAVLLCQE